MSVAQQLKQPTLLPRILVVEPCAQSATQLMLIFQEIGFFADTASTAAAARKKLAHGQYALVVIESELLPDGSGYALSSWCRDRCLSQGGGTSLPVPRFVSLTARPDLEAASHFGHDACVSKPVTARCVLRLARQWMEECLAATDDTGTTGFEELMRFPPPLDYLGSPAEELSGTEGGCGQWSDDDAEGGCVASTVTSTGGSSSCGVF